MINYQLHAADPIKWQHRQRDDALPAEERLEFKSRAATPYIWSMPGWPKLRRRVAEALAI